MAELKPSRATKEESQKSGPSGATTKLEERESKFDEEGGAQPQAAQVPVAGKHNQQSPQLKNGR